MDSASNARILTHAEHQRRALAWRVACNAFLQVLAGSRQCAEAEPRTSEGIVGDDREGEVVSLVRCGLSANWLHGFGRFMVLVRMPLS
jgi:hypothetical protein